MPTRNDEPTSPVRPADVASNSLLQRTLARAEPVLQQQGFVYTFIIIHLLLNLIFFFVGAPPAWRKGRDQSFAIQAAGTIARGGGAMLNYNAALIILIASRNFMAFLRQTVLSVFVPFDKAMPAFHSLIGNCIVVATGVHVLGHIIRYSILRLRGPGFFGPISLAVSGSLLTIVLLAMRITSMVIVRRKSFETFYWVHSIGSITFFFLIIMHGSHVGRLKTYMYVCGPIIIYTVDRTVRMLREKSSRLSIRRNSAVIKGNDLICLSIPRTFSYLAGQYCDIKVPLVSHAQWHPFTIASSPHESEMRFYIKVNGDWTSELYALFKDRDGDMEEVQIHVRGPYGAPAQHVGQYENVVLISGGVGATPFASITKYVHHCILKYTSHGAATSNTVSAAFTRNQRIQGTPSVPGTPTMANSGNNLAAQHSAFPSRDMSTRHSPKFTRPDSRNYARKRSRGVSRPVSCSEFGRVERVNASRKPKIGRQISRSGCGAMDCERGDRPRSGQMSRSGSSVIDLYNSTHNLERATSGKPIDSIGNTIQEQRANQPYGPTTSRHGPQSPPTSLPGMSGGFRPNVMSFVPPGMEITSCDGTGLQRHLDTETSSENTAAPAEKDEFLRPNDYDEELGNPNLPIPDRRHGSGTQGKILCRNESGFQEVCSLNQPAFEITTEYNSSHGLIHEDKDQVKESSIEDVRHVLPRRDFSTDHMEERLELEAIDLEAGQLELEDQILREQNTASNAYNLLGMRFGPLAMMRHMHALDSERLRSSMLRASMNLTDDAMDAALWQDRILFYLHTVTINWVLMWLMLARFCLVLIGVSVEQFTFEQRGLGIFEHASLNVVDLVLAILVTVPIVGAVVMEMMVKDVHAFLTDTIANPFDVFVLAPLLIVCITLHILNLSGVGTETVHVSKLTVICIWPVVSLFILWRIVRTIGSRIVLAPHFNSTHGQTKSLDYIWVSRTHEDDSWLIDELLPLAESNIVRLHRFITRHGPKTERWMLEYENLPLKTTYSRPDWDDLFSRLVERSKSGTVIGVFFCGPDIMAQMVQQAAMKAMAKSMDNAYQRGYFSKKAGGRTTSMSRSESMAQDSATGDRTSGSLSYGQRGGPSSHSRDGGRNGSMQRLTSQSSSRADCSRYGCSVRIAVRIENFS